MRKVLIGLLVLVVIAAIGFFGLAPGIVERSMNKVVPVSLPHVSDSTRALHARLQIADMHADTMLWRRDFLSRGGNDQFVLGCFNRRRGHDATLIDDVAKKIFYRRCGDVTSLAVVARSRRDHPCRRSDEPWRGVPRRPDRAWSDLRLVRASGRGANLRRRQALDRSLRTRDR